MSKKSASITNTSTVDIFHPQMIELKEVVDPLTFSSLKKEKPEYTIDDYLMEKVKAKIGGKCIDIGYIDNDSIKIISRSIGFTNASHFNGQIYYHLKVEALVCKPSEGCRIRAQVLAKNKIGILAVAEPLQIILAFVHENTNALNNLQLKSFITVEIISYKYELGDTNIKVIGKLVI